MTGAPRPIGYWLKRADTLLTQRIDEAHSSDGLTRLEWQTLSVLRQAAHPSLDDVADALAPFADRRSLAETLRDLTDRGVIGDPDAGGYALTEEGEALFGRAAATQDALRRRAADGIPEPDYRTTLLTLQRIVENLEDRTAPKRRFVG